MFCTRRNRERSEESFFSSLFRGPKKSSYLSSVPRVIAGLAPFGRERVKTRVVCFGGAHVTSLEVGERAI